MISQLSDFLRLTLSGSGEAEITLADEVRFARQYLEIERVRFGDRLAVTIEVAPEVESLRVPALILLPIVENAVRHAVERNERGGEITIRASLHENALRLSVTDDGPGGAAVPIAGSGIGLSNTRARLHQLFGSQQLLRRSSLENGGSEYLMEIPARYGAQSHAQLVDA